MIAFVRTVEDLQRWADAQAVAAKAAYEEDGDLVNLGYAMAMRDIARSVMTGGAAVEWAEPIQIAFSLDDGRLRAA